jgi:hypothetical protein
MTCQTEVEEAHAGRAASEVAALGVSMERTARPVEEHAWAEQKAAGRVTAAEPPLGMTAQGEARRLWRTV